MKRSLGLIVILCVVIVAIGITAAAKKPKGVPLPALPSQGIIDTMVSATGGAVFTPLSVSSVVAGQSANFSGVFAGVALDTSRAVHYITTKGDVLETLVPAGSLGDDVLAPDVTTPGTNAKPAKILGVWYKPSLPGPRWVVVTFKPDGQPDKIRFYKPNNAFNETDAIVGSFGGSGRGGRINPEDEGAAISDKRSCITVGLNQVCWEPLNHEEIRDETKPEKKIKDAENELKGIYELDVKFDGKNAVPDLLGKAQREACAAALSNAAAFESIDACKANAVLAMSKTVLPNQPIALLDLLQDADIRAYDAQGNYVGVLPADRYLVMETPVSSTDAGTSTALFLVGASGNNYLVPSTIVQGFGAGAIGNTRQAGIRDGFCGYRLFGW